MHIWYARAPEEQKLIHLAQIERRALAQMNLASKSVKGSWLVFCVALLNCSHTVSFLNAINYVMAHSLLLPRRALCTRVFNVTSRSCDLAAEAAAATKGLLSLQPARVPEENAAAQADQSANRLVPPPKQKATEHSPSSA
jgi:hypothetical protein